MPEDWKSCDRAIERIVTVLEDIELDEGAKMTWINAIAKAANLGRTAHVV